jgi:four helix bundle protein
MSGTFEDLQACRLAMDLAAEVDRCTRLFPKAELYGLTDQMKRSAVSIPSNIAEGKGRSSDRELLQFLNHARGALYELQTQIKLAARLSYLESDPRQQDCLASGRSWQSFEWPDSKLPKNAMPRSRLQTLEPKA